MPAIQTMCDVVVRTQFVGSHDSLVSPSMMVFGTSLEL